MGQIRSLRFHIRHRHMWYFLFFTYALGLVGITRAVLKVISERVIQANGIIPLTWLEDSFFRPAKLSELLVFVGINAAIFLYLLLFEFLRKYFIRPSCLRYALGFHNDIKRFVYIVFGLFFNIIAVATTSTSIGMLASLVFSWPLLLALAWLPMRDFAGISAEFKRKVIRAEKILIVILICHFVIIVAPFCFGELKVMNEYLDIPEKTLMKMPGAESYYVDNHTFINQHSLMGFHYRYDIRAQQSQPVSWNVAKQDQSFIKLFQQKEYSALAAYSPEQGEVIIIQPFSDAQYNKVLDMVNTEDKDAFRMAQELAKEKQWSLRHKTVTAEEKLFIKNNQFEFHWQILNRWFIHHHNFILNPLQEYALGKDNNKIFSQYVWLPIIFLKNLLEKIGSISYHDYIKVWYFIYFIYFAAYILLFWLIFKSREYLVLLLLLIVVGFNISEYTFFYLAPGWNPVRHFFDIFIFYSYFRFVTSNRLKWLVLSYGFIALTILFNWQFGLFLLASLTGAVVISTLLEVPVMQILKNRQVYTSLLLTVVLCPLLWCARFGEDGFSAYHLLGLLGFPSDSWTKALLIGIYVSGWCLLFRKHAIAKPWKALCIFSLGYSFLSIIYYIRSPFYYHITSVIWIHALAFFSFMCGMKKTFVPWKKYEQVLIGFMVVVLVVAYIPSTGFFYYTKYKFDQVFKNHQVYQWDFPKAKFLSTMNPEYFSESVDLMKHYDSNPGVYILSKYDNFIPFLANKYSNMPFPDLTQFLITTKEVEKSVQSIVVNKPTYLFVDTDIDRSLIVDVMNKESPLAEGKDFLYTESIWRVQRIGLLKKIFDQVREDYEPIPVAAGKLLSVYRRKSDK